MVMFRILLLIVLILVIVVILITLKAILIVILLTNQSILEIITYRTVPRISVNIFHTAIQLTPTHLQPNQSLATLYRYPQKTTTLPSTTSKFQILTYTNQ